MQSHEDVDHLLRVYSEVYKLTTKRNTIEIPTHHSRLFREINVLAKQEAEDKKPPLGDSKQIKTKSMTTQADLYKFIEDLIICLNNTNIFPQKGDGWFRWFLSLYIQKFFTSSVSRSWARINPIILRRF